MNKKLRKILSKVDYYFISSGITFLDNMLMTLDDKYYLHRIEHPPSPLFICTIDGTKPNLNDIVFYNDCLAYLHDVPFIFRSAKQSKNSPHKPIKPIKKNKYITKDTSYYDTNIQNVFDAITDIKFNGNILFLWEESYLKAVNINLHSKYRSVLKEIQLYSMALKQVDPLTEFLCYYRVIESVSGNNGKTWIRNNLGDSIQFDYGFVEIIESYTLNPPSRRRNLFTAYKTRARRRIAHLNSSLGTTPIEKYLYNEIRCGVAHGKDNVVTYDYDTNLKEISKDIFIIKLLARYAIEKKAITSGSS
ncbi:methylamine utilization protein MauJ [Thiovibrio frasassiensis]|uniref:Uncharacterized protein n=1 Tax=Thiovibrio frasassiensis TaxID=2984131 RepID=A0A9X4RKS7_9BACT|nr:methylamine utilization protein MauJ [Thiovibrio frasassiensis]MDG4474924.1 hypothetical protein [Thiovibrio frasassiensis]